MSAALAEACEVDAITQSWAIGDLSYLCEGWQREARDFFWDSDAPIIVYLCSRQIGKTTLGAIITHEVQRQVPLILDVPANIRIAASTGVDLKENLEPAMALVADQAPSWAKSHYTPPSRQEPGRWNWDDGAKAVVAGVNGGNEDKLRGRTNLHLGWIEEGSTVDRLDYLYKSVLRWQAMRTRADKRHRGRFGKLLITLTPPESPAHDSVKYIQDAEAKGRLIVRAIHDADMPHVTREVIEEFARECGGETTTAWRREALCQIIVEETRAVVPEFQREEKFIVEARERPSHFVARVAMDVGYHDLTFAVFGYYDFDAGLDVITHEVVLQHATSADINAAVAALEPEAFGHAKHVARFVDAPAIVVADLRALRGIPAEGEPDAWSEARKDDADAALNALRVRVRNRQLRIHPRCTHLTSHLRHAIWNKARTTYERSGDHGHFDGVDAAKYFVRHLDRATNPFPLLAPGVKHETHHIPDDLRSGSQQARTLFKAIKGRR